MLSLLSLILIIEPYSQSYIRKADELVGAVKYGGGAFGSWFGKGTLELG